MVSAKPTDFTKLASLVSFFLASYFLLPNSCDTVAICSIFPLLSQTIATVNHDSVIW